MNQASSTPERLLLGTNYHPASEEVLHRHRQAASALLALPGTRLVNLQFPDEIHEVDGFRTVPSLTRDSLKATGRKGARKPLARQVFDLLADLAEQGGHPYFAWVNADIVVDPSVIDAVASWDRDCYFFSRTDVSEQDGSHVRIFWVGIDLFVIRVSWWRKHRHRFRNYVIGDALYDPVFTTIGLSHSNGILFNNRSRIFHPDHPRAWAKSPFSDWNIFLSCLDFLYLERWNRYTARLKQHPPEGVTDEGMIGLQDEHFRKSFPPRARVIQVGRSVKALGRYLLNRAGLIPSVYYSD